MIVDFVLEILKFLAEGTGMALEGWISERSKDSSTENIVEPTESGSDGAGFD